MAEKDPVDAAIRDAELALNNLAGPKRAAPDLLGRAGSKVPKVKSWQLPITILGVLFAGQTLAAALVDDGTIGAIFAVGAVVIAILTATVAVLSYARQASIPLGDILKILDKLLSALKEIKNAQADPSNGDNARASGEGDDAGPTAN
jgi:hypothetical protein